MRSRICIGVDGCRKGWIAVAFNPADAGFSVSVHPAFAALCGAFPSDALVAVDMPIGLPDMIGPSGRGPETAIRAHLGPRRSSVFSVPSRSAIYAETGPFADEAARYAAHRRASLVARQTSNPPRAISIQAFGLFAKIREVDQALRHDAALAARVYESHPEMAFAALSDGAAMNTPKKIKGRIHRAGMAERRAVLMRCGVPKPVLSAPPLKGVGEDDFLDAVVLSLVARRIIAGQAQPYPDPPGHDRYGLPIAIWA